MSSYIVSPEHVGALAAFAMRQKYPLVVLSYHDSNQYNTAKNIAKGLMEANIASVAYRYPNDKDGGRPGLTGYTDEQYVSEAVSAANTYMRTFPALRAVDIIAMARCLNYQSCEVDDWDSTPAYKQIRDIVEAAINTLPDYEGATRDFYDDQFHKQEPL